MRSWWYKSTTEHPYCGSATDLLFVASLARPSGEGACHSREARANSGALQLGMEIRTDEALHNTLKDAFPGSRLDVEDRNGRFELQLQQHGLLRPLSAAELSDGTLRFLLWIAALLTPRPPELMVLNEPETSLHPDLLPALARLILAAARHTQIIVVSHAQTLISALAAEPLCTRLHLQKDLGETKLEGATLFNTPKWVWPTR